MKLSIPSIQVQAKTRKLKTHSLCHYRGNFLENVVLIEYEGWSIEQARDLYATHGIDIVAEMLKILQEQFGS